MTKVRATKKGYYGTLRRVGDEFEIKDEAAFSKRWMELVDAPAKSSTPKTKADMSGKEPVAAKD